MLPVLNGLLPAPHNDAILDLVFVMGCWHVYAKLRLWCGTLREHYFLTVAKLGG